MNLKCVLGIFSLLCVAPLLAEDVITVTKNAKFGDILTGVNGMTLYVFQPDRPNMSTCYGKCAEEWPPLLLTAEDSLTSSASFPGKLGTITRRSKTRQVTFNGLPVYYFYKDRKPGDVKGHNVGPKGKKWFVAKPEISAAEK